MFRRVLACHRSLSRAALCASSPQRAKPAIRCLSSSPALFENKIATKAAQNADWNRAISEAEKIVGYPTSFLNLRWILNDEVATVALHLRKIMGSNHPLLKTAKSLLYNEKTLMQPWALIVLLLSRAAGHAPHIPESEVDTSTGILHTQRGLAEIAEMIRISILIHQSMINLQPLIAAGGNLSEHGDETFGNKIGLLTGDYLLTVASNQLSTLRNQFVVESISQAIRDLAEGEFVGDRDEQNNPIPARPKGDCAEAAAEDDFDLGQAVQKLRVKEALGHAEREWTVRHLLSKASLLGRSCQSALMLAGQPEELQRKAYLFGKHLALAWQTSIDLEPFQVSTVPPGATFSLVSAPVLFHLDAHPEEYAEVERAREGVAQVDFAKLHADILEVDDGQALERTRQLQRRHIIGALKVLDEWQDSDAKRALQNVLVALQEM